MTNPENNVYLPEKEINNLADYVFDAKRWWVPVNEGDFLDLTIEKAHMVDSDFEEVKRQVAEAGGTEQDLIIDIDGGYKIEDGNATVIKINTKILNKIRGTEYQPPKIY